MSQPFLHLSEPNKPAPRYWSPFALGFRPLFMGAGISAIVLMAIWLSILFSLMKPPASINAVMWHAHEMLFGFGGAVIGGFLLTAAQTWTGITMPSGAPLIALFILWVVARVLSFIPGNLSLGLFAVSNFAYWLVLSIFLARPILMVRQEHNYAFPFMLISLAGANALVSAELLGFSLHSARIGLHLALIIILLMIVVMGGRVIPAFTDNWLKTKARRWEGLERVLPWITVSALGIELFPAPAWLTAALSLSAALLHGFRLAGWNSLRTWHVPLLWVLHAGYAWVVLGFLLSTGAALGWWPLAVARHAFTVGVIGVLTLGMMARVSLGHTGRMLVAAPITHLAFIFINLAALLRVGLPLFFPTISSTAHLVSGIIWSGAFILFLVYYAPILLHSRIDGKPG